jgi:hypothetical protein
MALTFGDRRWHDETTGTVTFPAFAGSARISCRITDEALTTVFGSGATSNELVETFDRCRASIEAAALKKFTANGDPLKLVLVTTDFETRAPAKPEPKTQSASEIAAMVKRYRASGGGNREPSLLHDGNIAAAMAAIDAAAGDEAGGDEAADAEAAPEDSAVASVPPQPAITSTS